MIKINGVSFNPKAVLLYKSADAFANHIGNDHLWSEIKPDARRERLKSVWNLCLTADQKINLISNRNVLIQEQSEWNVTLDNEPTQPVRPDTKLKKPRPASSNTRKLNSKKNASGGDTAGANL